MTRRFDRRQALKIAGALALGGAVSPALAHAGETTLRAAARQGGLSYGAAGDVELFTDTEYRTLFLSEAEVFTPTNALKFPTLQPTEGHWDFGTADSLVDGARAKGLRVHGHNLAWNDWLPDWVKALSWKDARRAFDAHIDKVVPHFAGRLVSWDVVNEPFYLGFDKPGTYRPGPWLDAFGPGYIFRAFKRTAELDPHAKLVLNEAWTERTDVVGLAVRRALLRLIDEIKDKGLRLDAVGLQAHLTPQIPYDDKSFADFLHEIAARKVEIYISEFDVLDIAYPDDITARDKAVAERTRAFLDAVLAVPAVTRVVTWGLSDRYSWWRDPSMLAAYKLTRLPRPLPYDADLKTKPMWMAMRDAFTHRAA